MIADAPPVRVLLAEGSELMRVGMEHVLGDLDGLEIVERDGSGLSGQIFLS